MYCPKCGAENRDSVKFCRECGNPLGNANLLNEEKKEKPSGKYIYYIISFVIILIAVVVAVNIGMQKKKEKEYLSHLETAEKYVVELNYEEAKECYLKAINIEPKRLKPYVEIAKLFLEENEIEKAVEILKKAEEQGATDEQNVIDEKNDMMGMIKRYSEDVLQLEEELMIQKEQLDIVKISAGHTQAIALNKDGTATVVFGNNEFGECSVDMWSDLTDIEAGIGYTLGIKKDGTICVAGYNEFGACEVDDWTDVKKIFAEEQFSAAIRNDGTVLITDNDLQEKVKGWTDIKEIALGDFFVVGLKNDGSVVVTDLGDSDYACEIEETICSWKDIVQIDSGFTHIVALKSDGTVCATGYNEFGACEVDSWKNIVSISAAGQATLAISADGNMYSSGIIANGFDENDSFFEVIDIVDQKNDKRIVEAQVSTSLQTWIYNTGDIIVSYIEDEERKEKCVDIYYNAPKEELNKAEQIQFDSDFMKEFPFLETAEKCCSWLEKNGYSYEFNKSDNSFEGEAPNGWKITGAEIYDIEGVTVHMHKFGNKSECNELFNSCVQELEAIYGRPSRRGEDYAWYTDGKLVVGVINFDESVQVQIGSINGMDKYL